jgi:endonuclease YncB( thermonuclease family)
MNINATLAATFMLFAIDVAFIGNATADSSYEWRVIDGDTFEIPPQVSMSILSDLNVSVRVRGVDTPEIKGKCFNERRKAEQAKIFTKDTLSNAKSVEIKNAEWDKYGGRIDADVIIDGKNLAKMLIERDLGRPYDGGNRRSWCK